MQQHKDSRYSVAATGAIACVIAAGWLSGCGPVEGAAQIGAASEDENVKSESAPLAAQSSPVAQGKEEWRKAMSKKALPKKGCFKALPGDTDWTETGCVTPPNIPYLPKGAPQPQTVGNGVDSQLQSSSPISALFGEVIGADNITSESDGTVDEYSLQVNTNTFLNPAACNGAADRTQCWGWQQYVFANYGSGNGLVYIQYWLINYINACPAGWTANESNCYKNSAAQSVPNQPISNLTSLRLVGAATSGGTDTSMIDTGDAGIVATGQDSVLGLGQSGAWKTAEFNVFGNGNRSQASFNSNATAYIRMSVERADGTSGTPVCASGGTTGETNNLNLMPGSCCPTKQLGGSDPFIQFTESNASSVAPLFCLVNATTPVLFALR
jgi:hypothetical protein